jgi:hypothetical protein
LNPCDKETRELSLFEDASLFQRHATNGELNLLFSRLHHNNHAVFLSNRCS